LSFYRHNDLFFDEMLISIDDSVIFAGKVSAGKTKIFAAK